MSRLHRFLGALALSVCALRVHAQSGDEVIEDPELGGSPSSGASAASGSGDEVIDDPELGGATSTKPSAPAADSGSSASAPPASEVHLTLHTRANRDLKQDDPREEIWESTTILTLDATLRRSDSLRFGLGIMARYHFASLAHSLPDTEPRRFEFDAIPTAAFIDGSVGSAGVHVRVGYQPVPLGRFDLFSAINVLAVADLRDGPATIPGLPEVGQFAFKLDYSPGGWLSVQAIYLPFFMPHIVSIADSDYALFPGKQANTAAVFDGLNQLVSTEELQPALRSRVTPSGREKLAQGALAAFTPPPNLLNPQGAVRATAHDSWGEFSLTLATALEHFPTFRLSDSTVAAISGKTSDQFDPNAVSIEYKRFAILSADVAVDLAPFSLGFEFAYQMHRTLYAVGNAYPANPATMAPGDPLSIPIPGYSDMLQGGARIEYAESTEFIFAIEAFAQYALSLPNDPQRGWMYLETGRFFRGVGGIVGYSADFGLRLQVAAAWLSGPTIAIAPRISYEIISQLEIEVGAFILEGQAPPPYATPILSLGGTFTNVDHVFLGMRASL